MDDTKPHRATTPDAHEPAPFRERRMHPRFELEEPAPAAPPATAPVKAGRLESIARRVLVRLGLRGPLPGAPCSHYPDRDAASRARLAGAADRLEAVVAELDALGAWREAVDVCSAIERLRRRTDQGPAGMHAIREQGDCGSNNRRIWPV